MNAKITKNISSLIESIYNTVEHPSCWQEVLQELAGYVDDGKAAITIRDNNEKNIIFDRYKENKVFGLDSEGISFYMTKAHKFDVWIPYEVAMNVGEICQFSKYLPKDELKKTRFYKEWLFSVGIEDGISLQLFKNDDIRVVLNVFFVEHSNQVDNLLKTLESLKPHLCKAVKLWMRDVGVIMRDGLNIHCQKIKDEYKITEREWEFLVTQIRTGNNAETAKIMDITKSTAYTYTKRIYEKLNVDSLPQAALLLDGFTNEF